MGIKVLVPISSSIGRVRFIEERLRHYIPSGASSEIMVVNDRHHVAKSIFGEFVTDIDPGLGLREKRKLVDSADLIVCFWDGEDISDYVYLSLLCKRAQSKVVVCETTKVVNKDRGDKYDVYIGRGSLWGNPYAIGQDGMGRFEAIERYRRYFHESILSDPSKRRALMAMRGLRLGCHCKPSACHGDVIAEYLNSIEDEGPSHIHSE